MSEAVELWKGIPGYSAYEASNLGNIRSVSRIVHNPSTRTKSSEHWVTGKLKSIYIRKDGYAAVGMAADGDRHKIVRAHRIIALTWVPNPKNKPDVNHKNGIKHDNRAENLEWCTKKENLKHAYDTGLNVKVKEMLPLSNVARFTPIAQYTIHGEFVSNYPSIVDAAEKTGFSGSSIKRVLSGKFQAVKGFTFRRIEKVKLQ